VKLLHTSDWHVGKVLKGQARLDEQIKALGQIVEVAKAERPDLVIVAGDLYDTASPTADATKVVTRALSALKGSGAEVVAIGGNHDNGPALDALRPWADAAGISLRGAVSPRQKDHIIAGTTERGENWRLVALPFLSQRFAVRASEMFDLTDAEATQTYADHIARLIEALTASAFGTDTINLITTHLTVLGATQGGGEREAHTIMGYAVPVTVFPQSAHFVALGHLHRAQTVPGPCPVHYSGSPLAIDFGEAENLSGVSIVDVTRDTSAKVRTVPITAATPLRTIRGTLADLEKFEPDDSWLRVFVREAPRAGLREEVQALLPKALEVRIDPAMLPETTTDRPAATRAGRSPQDLFSEYLTSRGHADEATLGLFGTLYEQVG
jgi:DNA repair protein SbcD/Mre11